MHECLCDLQMAFIWLLKARWAADIDLDLIKLQYGCKYPPNPSEPNTLEASDVQKSFLKQWITRMHNTQVLFLTGLWGRVCHTPLLWTDFHVGGCQNSKRSNNFAISKGERTVSTVCSQYNWGHSTFSNFRKRFTATAQCFRKVRKSHVFAFKHSTHMACSSVSYTAVLKGMRQFENNPGHICCDVKNDMVHHLLQPFFGCNEEVQTVCKSLLRDESTTTEGKSSIDKLDAKIYRWEQGWWALLWDWSTRWCCGHNDKWKLME